MRPVWPKHWRAWALALLCASAAAGQGAPKAPDKGRFLVARETLGDPNFFQTVVLLLDYDEKGAMGVVVNRPSSVPIRDLFPKLTAFDAERVYLGGPVDPEALLLVVRHATQPEGFSRVSGDLYAGASVESLTKLLAAGEKPGRIRAYAGYAGWGPGQLDREIEQGSWIVAKAASEPVFDPNPQALWRKLIEGSQVRFAWLGADALLH